MYRQIGDLAAEVQTLSHTLHSPKLDLIGLKAAVGRFCQELSNRHDVKIDVHFENVPEALPAEISLCLYRVLQEALQNVLKHGVPRRADVSLSGHIETVHLTVKDSGPGFDPHEAMRGSRARLDQHERAAEGRGRTSFHRLATGARHNDSRCRAAEAPSEVYNWSRVIWAGSPATRLPGPPLHLTPPAAPPRWWRCRSSLIGIASPCKSPRALTRALAAGGGEAKRAFEEAGDLHIAASRDEPGPSIFLDSRCSDGCSSRR